MNRLRLWTLAAAGAALAVPADATGVEAVATIKPIHSLVARVMEGVGEPKVLISGSASPHSYAMKPSEARALNKARVFFRVSEAIEPFTGKIVKSLPDTVTVVTLAEAPGIELLEKRAGGAFEAHKHGDGHKDKHAGAGHGHEAGKPEAGHGHDELSGGRDHHIWLDPENAKAMTDEIARALAKADAPNAATYEANAVKLKSDIDALSAELEAQLKPVAGKPFVVFHDAYQYFERRFGLNAVGSITVTPNAEPSAKRLSAIRKKIAGLAAVCVFAEPQFEPRLLKTVVEGARARTGTLDPEGMSIPPGRDSYFTLMRKLGENLRGCLSPSA